MQPTLYRPTRLTGFVDFSVGYSIAFALVTLPSGSLTNLNVQTDLAKTLLQGVLLGTPFAAFLLIADPVRILLRRSLPNGEYRANLDYDKFRTVSSPYLATTGVRIRSIVYFIAILFLLILSDSYSIYRSVVTSGDAVASIFRILVFLTMLIPLIWLMRPELKKFGNRADIVARFNYIAASPSVPDDQIKNIREALERQDFGNALAFVERIMRGMKVEHLGDIRTAPQK